MAALTALGEDVIPGEEIPSIPARLIVMPTIQVFDEAGEQRRLLVFGGCLF